MKLFDLWRLRVDADKCQVINITYKISPILIQISITNGILNVKYLAFYFNRKADIHQAVNKVKKRASNVSAGTYRQIFNSDV